MRIFSGESQVSTTCVFSDINHVNIACVFSYVSQVCTACVVFFFFFLDPTETGKVKPCQFLLDLQRDVRSSVVLM